jgi:hypothetical protein
MPDASPEPFRRKALKPAAILTGFVLVLLFLLRLSLHYNQYPADNWRSDFYADKSGYYIYLPATFIYGFHQQAYPDSIDFKLGNGFGFVNGRLMTKYPIGVSLLNAPFFLVAHAIGSETEGYAPGFSAPYMIALRTAAIFYLLAGSLLLFFFLSGRFSPWISAGTVLLLIAGTNLYYYTFLEPLMSHVYSWALAALLLFLTDKLWHRRGKYLLAALSATAALIVLTRPSNILLLAVVPLLDLKSPGELKDRLLYLIKPANLIVLLLPAFLLMLPQLVYWKFISGSFFFYSYQNEGFTNWSHPALLKVLLSPNNGLLPYTPIWILPISGLIYMLIRRKANGLLITALFIAQWYVVASWYMFFFGCSFGQRSFVEYLTLTSIPLATIAETVFRPRRRIAAAGALIITAYLIFFNIRMIHAYDRCYLGGDWEWPKFREHLIKAGAFPLPAQRFEWYNDFESKNSLSTAGINMKPSEKAFSGNYVNEAGNGRQFSDGFGLRLSDSVNGRIYRVEASMMCLFEKQPKEVFFACSVNRGDTTVYFSSENVVTGISVTPGSWTELKQRFDLPFLPPEGQLRVYMTNNETQTILNDDFRVKVIAER